MTARFRCGRLELLAAAEMVRISSSSPPILRSCDSNGQIEFFDLNFVFLAVAQDVPDQEEAGEEDEAEQANSSLDPLADGQHHQVRLL